MTQALIVLGMHRSGTSAVSGALVKLGAAAPANLMPEHPDNPRGYWESAPLARLNDRILAAAGSSWHDWRPIPDAWFEGEQAKHLAVEAAEALKQEFPGSGPIALKDPRICRLFPLWRSALEQSGYTPIIATPIRRPVEVAASLAKRDDFSMGRAYLIWLRYVLEAERTTRDLPRILFRWSDFMGDWRTVLTRLAEQAGGHLPGRTPQAEVEVDAFLDSDLRRQKHQSAVSADAPVWIAETFDALARLTDRADDLRARSVLDQVRRNFNETAAIYGPVFDGVETEYHHFQAKFEDERAASRQAEAALRAQVVAADAERNRVVEALQATERARVETEAGWAKEREAKTALDVQLTTKKSEALRLGSALRVSDETLLITRKVAKDQAARLENLVTVQAALEQDVARLETRRQEAERRGLDLAADLNMSRQENDRKSNEIRIARAELRDLLVRRRQQPVRTAWAVLRGLDG